MDGTVNGAIAFVLLDAVAVAVSVELGRTYHRGETVTATAVRVFICVLALLALALTAFAPLAIVCLGFAYLLRKFLIRAG
jgi:hypothetical protein